MTPRVDVVKAVDGNLVPAGIYLYSDEVPAQFAGGYGGGAGTDERVKDNVVFLCSVAYMPFDKVKGLDGGMEVQTVFNVGQVSVVGHGGGVGFVPSEYFKHRALCFKVV